MPSDQPNIEVGALVAHRLAFGGEPTEPVREKGGALDPRGWCMRYAEAVALAGPGDGLPRLASNVEPPTEWAERVAAAMDSTIDIHELI